jgi:energy-coupling factor transport system substrate-specific component|uniref:Energy-coupling factor transport system substrate-specific component n=1 Tax=Desulfobacca acetoxidans TaxID=60893 RepID=A0A7C5AMJ2_9BACT
MRALYFSTREYVLAALLAGALLVTASIVIPLTLPLRIPGLANAVNAPFASFFLVIGLARLRKPGSLLLILGLYATVCLLIHPVIFSFIMAGALVAEGVCWLLFRGFATPRSQVSGVVLYEVTSFPAAMLFSLWLLPARALKPAWYVFLVAEAAIVVTSLAGCLLGLKVARELARAGKLALED